MNIAIQYFESLDSTNQKIKELAKEGAPEGTIVVAKKQTNGRGRMGRTWESDEGAGIYMSLLLRPNNLAPEKAPMLTLVAALATAAALKETAPMVKPQIKWPNDLVCDGKKLCGILTEMVLSGKEIESIVVGIGVNVLQTSFPEGLTATSLALLQPDTENWNQEEIVENIAKQWEGYYNRFQETQDFRGLKAEYEALLVNKGKKVRVLDPKGEYEGVACGITEGGELVVDVAGEQRVVASGEVSVRGIYGYA